MSLTPDDEILSMMMEPAEHGSHVAPSEVLDDVEGHLTATELAIKAGTENYFHALIEKGITPKVGHKFLAAVAVSLSVLKVVRNDKDRADGDPINTNAALPVFPIDTMRDARNAHVLFDSLSEEALELTRALQKRY